MNELTMNELTMNELTNIKDSVFSDYRLKDFILDSSNTQALHHINRWIEGIMSGKAAHLQIYGLCGNGKTHLAAAALNHVVEINQSIVANCNCGRPISNFENIPNGSLLLCEGSLLELEKYSPDLLRKCAEKNVSVIFTCDRKIESISDIDSVEILKPTEELLQKIVASVLHEHPEISLTSVKNESVRATICMIKKEIFKKEIGIASR